MNRKIGIQNQWGRKIIAVGTALILALSMAACGTKPVEPNPPEPTALAATPEPTPEPAAEPAPTEKTAINLAALKGPTALGMANLMESNDAGTAANQYHVTLAGAPDEIVGKIVAGELDIAAVPTNLAATLYQKTKGDVRLAALNTLGVLYILEKGDTIQSVKDLEGKTIYATGQGSTPEYALNLILEKNGLVPGKTVTIEYKQEHAEIAPLLASGEASIALLPQPFVTSVMLKDPEIRVALDLTEEWDKATNSESGLTMGCIVVRSEFAEQNKEALDRFLEEYKASVEKANAADSLEHTAELSEKYDIMPKAVAAKAIPECNIVFIDGAEMEKIAGGFLQVLFDAEPKSVGGALPEDDFYYKK